MREGGDVVTSSKLIFTETSFHLDVQEFIALSATGKAKLLRGDKQGLVYANPPQ